MIQAMQIMLVTVVVTFATGFFVALLIHLLTKVISMQTKKEVETDEELLIALAIAAAGKKQT